jgi:adenylate cyclase
VTVPGDVSVRLEDIASCFEGVIPSPIGTCSKDGVPNVTYLSIVHRIDSTHVALSAQFFNKTRRNILENAPAQVILVAPESMDQYRLDLQFERTESSGVLFENVRSRLEAVASQTGMSGVFRLRGVDIYRVIDCRPVVQGHTSPHPVSPADYVQKLADYTAGLALCRDLESLVHVALEQLAAVFDHAHTFVMVCDEEGKRLYTLGSHGFPSSGIGSEVVIGEGLIGTAAERRELVRTTNFVRERVLSRAVRDELTRTGDQGRLDQEIALPGLPDAKSQLVVPLVARDELFGVLCLQSAAPGRFMSCDESAMQLVGRHLAAYMGMLGFSAGSSPELPAARDASRPRPTGSGGATIKYYLSDDSVFIDDEYLIKGVPGRIFHKLIQIYLEEGRDEFTNREIRLDAGLKLPDINANLEARLVLLRRRLEERCTFLKLGRSGRGRLHLSVTRPIQVEVHP